MRSRQYEYLSLAEVQGYSAVPRGSSLFDSIVVFENYPYDGDAATRYGLTIRDYSGEENTNYALTLSAYAADSLELLLGYDPDLFDESTAQRVLGHLVTVLDAIAEDPDVSLDQLDPLTERERTQVLTAWNDTAAPRPDARCVHEVFAEQAAATPTAVAVSCAGTDLTFAELDTRANGLAHHLVSLGVRPGVLVGVCVERGLDAVVALLAVLKAGGAFVPLDPDYPPSMLATMAEDANTPVVITQRRLVGLVETAAELVCVDEFDHTRHPATAPVTAVASDDLAYVVYTSGSTGRPKGVMVEHRHVRHMVRAWDTEYGLTELRARCLSVSSLSVDLFFGDFLLSALFGGTMVICPTEVVANPPALLDLLLDSRAQLMVTVPALARELAAELAWRGVRAEDLRVLMVGSEGWPAAEAARVWEVFGPDTVVVNAYGATETTVDSTLFRLGGDPVGDAAYVPVGRPFTNTRVYVLDARLRPVPVGVAGECYIAGDGIARGYLNRPELTADRFREDPFVPGERMYRTGDLVRWRADGNLECLGRTDDQVKIRGFRVELGHVESVLARCPGIAAAAAATWQDASGVVRLAGYVVPDRAAESTPDSRALREFASANLPAAAVPSAFVVLDALPMTPSGTVDRRALPTTEVVLDSGVDYVAPTGPVEPALAAIWAEVLDVARVGAQDNFFDLGGDSILSIRVISRIRAQFGVAVSPRQLFDTPTVAGLAQVLGTAGESTEPTGIGRVDRDQPLPAAAVVPQRVRTGQRRVQHGVRAAAARSTGPAGAARRPRPPGRAARTTAHHLHHPRRPGRPGGAPTVHTGPARGRPARAAVGGGRQGRGVAAVRPGRRPGAPRHPVPPGRAGPRADPGHPPHRHRRLVHGRARRGTGRLLRGGAARGAGRAGRAAGAVRGLRGLAAGSLVRTGHGRTPGVLAGAAGRGDPAGPAR